MPGLRISMQTKAQKIYLYAIYKLGQNGNAVRSADVARIVGVSKPSTVSMLQKLADDGYITKEPYREIELTKKGIKAANELYTPMVIVCDFLKNAVGTSNEKADKDAIIMVSQLSDETLDKFVDFAIKSKDLLNKK